MFFLAETKEAPFYLDCKIADFGLSRSLTWKDNLDGKVVDNPVWLAPEILNREPYSEKVDVYAFGVMMWELISGHDFFGNISFMSKIEEKIKNGERDTIPDNQVIPDYYIALLQMAWSQNPDDRPSFSQCIEKLNAKDIGAGGYVAEPPKFSVPSYSSLLHELESSEDY